MAAGTENLGTGSGGHAIMFHRDGAEFAGRVSAYLLGALREGGAAIVIATPVRAARSTAEQGAGRRAGRSVR